MERQPTCYEVIIISGIIAAGAAAPQALQAQGLGALDSVNNTISRNFPLNVDGWANFGVSYNPDAPESRYNGPVTFNDRDGELQLNQLYLLAERRVTRAAGQWDVGGRVDFLFGSDAQFAQALGSPAGHWDARLTGNRFYNVALPQAYLELFAPFGNGVTAKLGHFYTIIGNESVLAPDNFFYSHSYTMQYGEPFTHTGVLFDYPLRVAGAGPLSGWARPRAAPPAAGTALSTTASARGDSWAACRSARRRATRRSTSPPAAARLRSKIRPTGASTAWCSNTSLPNPCSMRCNSTTAGWRARPRNRGRRGLAWSTR